MKKTAAIGALLAAPLLAFGAGNAVAAPVNLSDPAGTVEFLDIKDAVAGTVLFNAAGSSVSGDTLNIGLSSFKFTGNATVSDVVSFTIKAKENQVITSVSYGESGTWVINSAQGGFVSASANWTVGGVSDVVGSFVSFALGSSGGNWYVPGGGSQEFASISFAPSDGVTELYVSIANVLSAAAATGGSASIEKTSASVSVGTAVIPLPPSVWLLGSALFGVGVLGRRMQGVKSA